MASGTNFNTSNSTFRSLFGNGLTYRVPHFQRDYSWTEEEWEDLWLDIIGAIRGDEPDHYMGYLVLQSNDAQTFDVIDGQQRLTTLSLIVLAVMKNLKRLVDADIRADDNQRRLDQIRSSYIGYLDPVTLTVRPKLTLNRNNNSYYQHYLVELGNLPVQRIKASEQLMRKAFSYFESRVRGYAEKQEEDEGTVLARFVELVSLRLFFTVIIVTDELNAYKVFETLNARGVRLSATDLLKNYLFSTLYRENRHDSDLQDMENRWEVLVNRLGSESFPDFLRVHWNSRHSPVRQTELFKTIRANIRSAASVFTLLREMDEDLETYIGLTQPETSGWTSETRDHVAKLRMFRVRQPFSLLLAARRTLNDTGFEQLLRACVMISFRYNVIGGQSTGEQERVYGAATAAILNTPTTSPNQIILRLADVYPSDEQFSTSFRDKSVRTTQSANKRIVRYLLCEIEKQMGGTAPNLDDSSMSIEHILPEHPGPGWESFPANDLDAFVYRLGNMTLMASGRNNDLGNLEFAAKRPHYEQSAYQMTVKVAEQNTEWTPERLDNRQRQMAKRATAIWRIAQLSGDG